MTETLFVLFRRKEKIWTDTANPSSKGPCHRLPQTPCHHSLWELNQWVPFQLRLEDAHLQSLLQSQSEASAMFGYITSQPEVCAPLSGSAPAKPDPHSALPGPSMAWPGPPAPATPGTVSTYQATQRSSPTPRLASSPATSLAAVLLNCFFFAVSHMATQPGFWLVNIYIFEFLPLSV